MAGKLLLPVYEYFVFVYTLAFCDHFCWSFGKPKNGAIYMSLFYMYFCHYSLIYSSAVSFPKLSVITKLNETNYNNGKNELFDNHWVNICFESNIIDVSSDTWWLDSGATIHFCNSMQAVISRRRPTSFQQYVYMGDDTRVQVVFLRVVRLHLSTKKKKFN